MKKTNEKGITLIALIITIIIMLILVMVGVNLALGEDGILKNAKTASADTEKKSILEELISMVVLTGDAKIDEEETANKAINKYGNQNARYDPVIGKLTIQGRTGTYDYKVTTAGISIWDESSNPLVEIHEGDDLGDILGSKYSGWIVIHEYEDRIEAISPKAMGELELGYENLTINWTDSEVIEEANIDGEAGLTNLEKSIYSYNHAIETINNYCKTLKLPANDGVRSVGASIDSTNEKFNEIPTMWPSDATKYNGKGKVSDNEYVDDWEKIQELLEVNNEDKEYWIASRWCVANNVNIHFYVRSVNKYGYLGGRLVLVVSELYWLC